VQTDGHDTEATGASGSFNGGDRIAGTNQLVWWLLPDSPLPDRERQALDRIATDRDRMIVATARVHDLPLATHDAAMRKSRLIKLWKA